mmetsp:Transcript_14314/g.18081  ORF Transcript_14314/g.18081 Transcript_14314/m.18081 type:complete len:361 (-) Transcript_14314:3-1085(-)
MKYLFTTALSGTTELTFLLSCLALSVVRCDFATFDGSPETLLLLSQHQHDRRAQFLSSSSSIVDFEQCSDDTNTVVSNLAVSLQSSDADIPRLKKEFFEMYCSVGYPNENEKELVCDFQPLSTRDDWYSQSLCEQAGGKLMLIPLELCNYTIPATDDFSTFEAVEKTYMDNLPLCTGRDCDEEQMSNYLLEIYEPLNLKCPVAPSNTPSHSPSLPPTLEGRYNRFALRYDANNALVTRSCNWLQMKPEPEVAAICQRKNFQLYTDEYLPASQVCFETCEPYCVEQALNAKFVLETSLDSSGEMVEEIRQCKWLIEKKTSEVIQQICSSTTEFESKYGQAEEVCTEICPRSPKACSASEFE